jgi:signal transduction histidine kinase
VYLVLAFPAGRLRDRVDRALVGAGALTLIMEQYLLPEFLAAALFAAVAVRLAVRLRGTSRLARRIYAPVLAACGAIIAGRAYAPEADVVEAAIWTLTLAMPMLAAAFLLGLVRWRLFAAEALWRLAGRLRGHPEPEDLRAALADAFDDPLLRDDAAFVDGATSYALITLENHRLSVETSALLREVGESRARIQKSADDERRRIEHDLHDGAQQRLVTLRIKLALAAERLDGDASADVVRVLGEDVDRLLDEVRSLARGIYPSPLADRGVVEALRSVALEAALPTRVVAADPARRYPREIESAVYFSCLEALQNACKHAGAASAVVVEISNGRGALRFDVCDDGAGFDPARATAGVGLTSIRDRLASVHGKLSIVSSAGRGTRVLGTIPLVADAKPPGAHDSVAQRNRPVVLEKEQGRGRVGDDLAVELGMLEPEDDELDGSDGHDVSFRAWETLGARASGRIIRKG